MIGGADSSFNGNQSGPKKPPLSTFQISQNYGDATVDCDDDRLEKLVADTHAEVDRMRAERGMPPWVWHRPNKLYIWGPLAELIRYVDEEGNEVSRDYSCRSLCGFTGNDKPDSLKALHDHYLAHPDHKISPYEAKKLREGKQGQAGSTVAPKQDRPKRQYRPRINSHATSVRPLSAFEQLHALKDSFSAEIATEQETIKRMEGEVEACKVHLAQLQSTYKVLSIATGDAGEVQPQPGPAHKEAFDEYVPVAERVLAEQ